MSTSNQSCITARIWNCAELHDIVSLSLDQALFATLCDSLTVPLGTLKFSKVSIDSRPSGPDSLFVALAGARHDGHDYLEAVAGAGARGALVSARRAESDHALWQDLAVRFNFVCFPVSDPLGALQDFAAHWLRTVDSVRRIGITGSTGKTTTKELVRSVLSVRSRVFASPGNLNSVIGLPLAALAVGADCDFAVFEMAMSEKGEMARLAEIVCPDFAIVTSIGTAHIGNIGSQEGIAYEKKQIFSKFSEKNIGLLPSRDPWSQYLQSGLKGVFHRFGEDSTPGYEGVETSDHGQVIKFRGERMHLSVSGQHNRTDALAAIHLADLLGMSAGDIRTGIEAFKPAFGRSEIIHGRITLVQDCYNANPESMAASIRAVTEMDAPTGRRVLILGDMGELGDYSASLHATAGRVAVESGAAVVLFCGTEMQAAFEAALEFEGNETGQEQHIAWFASRDELASCVDEYIEDGDLVLLKASRSMEMEKLSPILLSATKRIEE